MASGEDSYEGLRRKPLYTTTKHAEQRLLDRASLEKVIEAVENGHISPQGRDKYRAVLLVEDGKLLVVVFRDRGEYLVLLTVFLTGCSRRRRPWG